MKKLLSTYGFFMLFVGSSWADDKKTDSANDTITDRIDRHCVFEEFIKYYYRKPDPDRVPAMLDLVLREKSLDEGIFGWPSATASLEDLDLKEEKLANKHAGVPVPHLILAHAFGQIGRGNPKLIRLYESRFAEASETGKVLLIDALRICGDDLTQGRLMKWSRDPAYRKLQRELEKAASFLADPKHLLPRDQPATTLLDLELLWADFFITGQYEPVSRMLDILDRPGNLRQRLSQWLKNNPGDQEDILETLGKLKLVRPVFITEQYEPDGRMLDILDRPGNLRQRLSQWLKNNPGDQEDILETLGKLKLVRPGTQNELAPGDLELKLFHDAKGRLTPFGIPVAFEIGKDCLHFSYEELYGGLILQGVTSATLQENFKEHSRLKDLLKKHYAERPWRSQDLVKKWLRIDQPKIMLDKESERLQGTWQAIAWEEGEPEPHGPKIIDPKVKAEILKYVRWKFEDDEWIMTRAFTVTGLPNRTSNPNN